MGGDIRFHGCETHLTGRPPRPGTPRPAVSSIPTKSDRHTAPSGQKGRRSSTIPTEQVEKIRKAPYAMQTLILLGVVGLLAQLVDGSLGMGYGVTSTTLLLAIGATPAGASATVHLAQIGTTLSSGLSHWRLGNVDWRVVRRIAIPGGIGAFLEATVLSTLSTRAAAPLMPGLLLLLGCYVLLRFTVRGLPRGGPGKPLRGRFL